MLPFLGSLSLQRNTVQVTEDKILKKKFSYFKKEYIYIVINYILLTSAG